MLRLEEIGPAEKLDEHELYKNIEKLKSIVPQKDRKHVPHFRRTVWYGQKRDIDYKNLKKIGIFPCLLVFEQEDGTLSYKGIHDDSGRFTKKVFKKRRKKY